MISALSPRAPRTALAAALSFGLGACAAATDAPQTVVAPAAPIGEPRDVAPPAPPPPPPLVVLGAVAFAPVPPEFDQTNPIAPTLGERLAAGVEGAAVRATGNAWGMAILCRHPETLARLAERGDQALKAPDLVLLTRAPTDGERAQCAANGVALEAVRIGNYLGGLPNDAEVAGAWAAYDAERLADAPEKQALIGRARLLIGADAYSKHFSAL